MVAVWLFTTAETPTAKSGPSISSLRQDSLVAGNEGIAHRSSSLIRRCRRLCSNTMKAVYVIYNLLLAVALAGQRSLLVRSPAAAGEVPRGNRQPARDAAGSVAFPGCGRQAGDLGACGVGRRNSCRGRAHPGNAEAFRGLCDCHLHDHQHGPQVGGRTLRRGECFLLPARSQLCRSAVTCACFGRSWW